MGERRRQSRRRARRSRYRQARRIRRVAGFQTRVPLQGRAVSPVGLEEITGFQTRVLPQGGTVSPVGLEVPTRENPEIVLPDHHARTPEHTPPSVPHDQSVLHPLTPQINPYYDTDLDIYLLEILSYSPSYSPVYDFPELEDLIDDSYEEFLASLDHL